MNCFNNNRPKLSSSERIKNKKAQAIFKANVMDYQKRSTGGNGKCSNYKGTVGFYNNGQLRNTKNYDTLFNLNRGSALCLDGAYKNNCINLEDISGTKINKGLNACSKNNKVKITLGNDNIYTIFSGYPDSVDTLLTTPLQGFLTMTSYIFNGSKPTPNNNQLPGKFNLKEKDSSNSVIVLDPSNNLFGTNFCPTDMNNITAGPNKYLQYSSVNSFLILEGFLYFNNTKIDCEETENVPDIYDLVLLGKEFTSNTSYKILDNVGIGYTFKKCCGIGPNGENGWWTIYVRPLIIKSNNYEPNFSSAGFFKASSYNSNTQEVTVTSQMGKPNTGLIYTYGAGDPCNRNLQSGNNTQQNYLISYQPTTSKTKFNINPQIYNITNTKQFKKISSSNSSSSRSSSNIINDLTDFTDLFMFENSGQALFQTTNLFSNIINAPNFSTSASNQYAALYNSGFDRDSSNTGDEDTDGSKYKSVILKLNKSNNTFTFRRTPYQITSNTIPIKTILTESNLFSSAVIDKLFNSTNQDYLAFVYSQGRIGGSSSDLFGNIKVTGQLTTTTQSNWLNHSGKSTISSHSDTLNKNYGSLQDTNNYNLLVSDNIVGDIYVILLFKNEN